MREAGDVKVMLTHMTRNQWLLIRPCDTLAGSHCECQFLQEPKTIYIYSKSPHHDDLKTV